MKEIEELEKKGYEYHMDGDKIIITHDGDIQLDLTSIDTKLVFRNGGRVSMNALTSVGAKLVFRNGYSVWMNALTTVDVELVFKNDEDISLNSMKFISHMGEELELRYVDGDTMVTLSTKQVGDYFVHKAKCFQGRKLEDMDGCFVAEKDGLFAHGETVKKAIEDLKFKVLSKNINVDDLVSEIKEKGTINKNDFRLLTGACSFGVDKFLDEKGITDDEMGIDKVIEITKGAYGHRRIVELLE